jgi:hypothetical protein
MPVDPLAMIVVMMMPVVGPARRNDDLDGGSLVEWRKCQEKYEYGEQP